MCVGFKLCVLLCSVCRWLNVVDVKLLDEVLVGVGMYVCVVLVSVIV